MTASEGDLQPSMPFLDMDSDPEQTITTPAPRQYETIYVTSHKAPCRAGAFSPDGMLIATGSADASIKILDVERMISKSTSHSSNQTSNNNNSNQNSGDNTTQTSGDNGDSNADHLQNQDSNNGNDQENAGTNNNNSSSHQQHQQHNQHHHQQHSSHNTHPVIRTLYDHSEEVTYLQFHPTAPILASGSLDSTIKFYDYMRATAKRAHKTIQEASPIRCFTFHPSGSYMLVGCQQPTLRLYDVNTLKSFVSSNPLDQHSSPVTMIDYSRNASFYVTGSKDGDIKVWDGISNRCVNTFRRAHEGAVSSVKVSRNGKYILSSGKDSVVKLWEMNMCSCLMVYEGAQSSSSKNFRAQSIFNHTEEYVLYPDGRNTQLHSWHARTGRHLENLALCHNNSVRFIVHSETQAAAKGGFGRGGGGGMGRGMGTGKGKSGIGKSGLAAGATGAVAGAAATALLMSHSHGHSYGHGYNQMGYGRPFSCFSCNTMDYENESSNKCRFLQPYIDSDSAQLDPELIKGELQRQGHPLQARDIEAAAVLALKEGATNQTSLDRTPEDLEFLRRNGYVNSVVYNRTLHPINYIERRSCAPDEHFCVVRSVVRYEFVGEEIQSKFWMLERNCSRTCHNDCMLIGDRHRLRVCNSCCKTPDCNLGSGATHSISIQNGLLTISLSLVALSLIGQLTMRPKIDAALISPSRGF